MGESQIEWTDVTWNPTIGCTRVIRRDADGRIVPGGCDHCYAFAEHDRRHLAWKRGAWPTAPAQYHLPFSQVQLLSARLAEPLRWRKPRRVFVNSLSDLFHEAVPDAYIAQVFDVMARAPRHVFQILTKRPERMREWVNRYTAAHCTEGLPLAHVWLGVSVEDQRAANDRIPALLATAAAVRFLSCEPLLGPVDLQHVAAGKWVSYDALRGWRTFRSLERAGVLSSTPCPQVHWVIAGGESGPKYRAMDGAWARSLRDQCQVSGTAFFFKQWGGRTSKAGGRRLDGVEWSQYPQPGPENAMRREVQPMALAL